MILRHPFGYGRGVSQVSIHPFSYFLKSKDSIPKIILFEFSIHNTGFHLDLFNWGSSQGGGIARMRFATYYEYPKLSKFYKTLYNIVI